MAATTGTALFPGASTFPNTNVYPGQGNFPILQVLYSLDDVSDPTPSWTYVADSDVRSFSSSRGRESELSDFDAGTATLILDNRDRAFDPTSNSSIRPLNRWWLREQFSGETQDIFTGYAQSYKNRWPSGGWSDAECEVSLADEFFVLSVENLPTTNPPRDSYTNLVLSDKPDGYWSLGDDPLTATVADITYAPPDYYPSAPYRLGLIEKSGNPWGE